MLLKLSPDLTFPGMHVRHTHTQHRAYSNNGKVIIFRWEEQSSSHFNSPPPFFATTFGLDLENSLIFDFWSSVRFFKRPGLV